eukprot:1193662-Prorocentrum_minimum.AAC.7
MPTSTKTSTNAILATDMPGGMGSFFVNFGPVESIRHAALLLPTTRLDTELLLINGYNLPDNSTSSAPLPRGWRPPLRGSIGWPWRPRSAQTSPSRARWPPREPPAPAPPPPKE